MMDLAPAVKAIVNAAAAAPTTTGRPCRLRDSLAVHALLSALLAGRSRTAAAKAAGISEGALRLWLKLAASGDAVYAPLLEAANRIAEYRAAPPSPPASTGAQTSAVTAAPARQPISGAYIERWRRRREQIRNLRERGTELQRYEAADMEQDLRNEMRAIGVTWADVDAYPAHVSLNLPRNLPSDEVLSRYIKWCELTYRPSPNDVQADMNAPRWYRENIEPLLNVERAEQIVAKLTPGMSYPAAKQCYIAWCEAARGQTPTDSEVAQNAWEWYLSRGQRGLVVAS